MTLGDGVSDSTWVELGKITGTYGVKGWVKVFSYTEQKLGILDYQPWHLLRKGQLTAVELEQGKTHGKGIIVQLQGVEDRDQAALWVGSVIQVRRDQLPPAEQGEYYWSDLIGLQVVTESGVHLGEIEQMLSTGAHDVMQVRGDRERLIPFVQQRYVKDIDLDSRQMVVDWDPEF